ncbi:MAG: helix-turn-helix domain-containing protein [Planctomycetes bacterium]|nr:helix-turn-helix domain-containing protein [Planctomycetota bacterium]
MNKPQSATSRPSTLKRAFAMLSILPIQSGLPLHEAARLSALPKPTAYRILRALIELGQAAQDEATGCYRSTGRLSVSGAPGGDAIRAAAIPRMQALHRRLDETINLGILDGDRVRYLHVIESTRPLRLMTIPDAADPVLSTALGRAMLSAMEPSARTAILKRLTIAPRTAHTITRRKELDRLITEAARRRFAEEREENDLGVACLAVPLRGTAWFRSAAISVTVPTVRYATARRAEIITALQEIIP